MLKPGSLVVKWARPYARPAMSPTTNMTAIQNKHDNTSVIQIHLSIEENRTYIMIIQRDVKVWIVIAN